MFDPSHQTFDYFRQKGYSELESHKLAHQVLGRCMVHRAQPEHAPVSSVDKQNMSDNETENASEIIDLGFDVSEADVARPVLKAATLNAEIAFVRKEDSRQKGLPQLLVGYRLTEPAQDINGKTVGPGFTLSQRILLQPTGKYTESMMQDRLKRVHFAAAGAGRVSTGQWVGKPVRIRITFRDVHTDEATGQEYPASNDIGGVYPMPKTVQVAA